MQRTEGSGKLTVINDKIEHEQQKLDATTNDATYTDEQRQEVREYLDRLIKEVQSQFNKIRGVIKC